MFLWPSNTERGDAIYSVELPQDISRLPLEAPAPDGKYVIMETPTSPRALTVVPLGDGQGTFWSDGQSPAWALAVSFSEPGGGHMPDREVVVQRLTELNEEFRRLRAEHQAHEQELAELQSRPYLSPEQQWRESELKKLKLIGKDRMETLIRQNQAAPQMSA